MPIVPHGEIDPRSQEPLPSWFERLWDDALRKFAEQFQCDDSSPPCTPPQGGSEDARTSLILAETREKEVGE